MKYSTVVFFAIIYLMLSVSSNSLAQNEENNKYHPDYPNLFRPQNHDPNFSDFPEKSFYESRTDWQAIIDSTWGPGLPRQQKLNILDTYYNATRNEFDGFLSLGMSLSDWDTIATQYRDQITDSTSKGRFGALMSYFSLKAKDSHTAAADLDIISNTPLNPGTPIFAILGFVTIEHCGTVVTVTADTSILVLRAVPNHPLGLQPGDIILGYESVPYKTIMEQLIAAELPLLRPGAGAESANFDAHLLGAAMNWHLFDSIDILQYSTGNILNLSTAPMINLNIPPMLNNEQVEIPEIPFPDKFNDDIVSYGILDSTNIGYIYLFSEGNSINPHPDDQFYEAVNELQNTEGLIIDMRWNEGGWAFFDDAFGILFHESFFTLNGANRCSPSTVDLCPNQYSVLVQIKGNASSIYDHPIAVLLGPTCVSMGDAIAHRLRYHPMVKFFGKPPAASFGRSKYIYSFSNWYLRYSIEDMYHINQPGVYLNRSEFPIDFPVWHNPDDAANGIDAVVEASKSWINNMIHAYDVSIDQSFISPSTDTLTINAFIKNPPNHNLQVTSLIHDLDTVFVDSAVMYDDGFHNDSLAHDGYYGGFYTPTSEDIFTVSVGVTDLDSTHHHILPRVKRFTSIGPVIIEDFFLVGDTIANSGDNIQFKITLRNDGSTATAENILARISELDTNITITIFNIPFGDIAAGQSKVSPIAYSVLINSNCPSNYNIPILVEISTGENMFWSDSIYIHANPTGIEKEYQNLPKTYSLKQNFPNPFNPSTTIEFNLPKTGEVSLKVFNILGEEVATLVSDRLSTGSYSYEWDASNLASGVYLYRLQAGDYVKTRKMVVMK